MRSIRVEVTETKDGESASREFTLSDADAVPVATLERTLEVVVLGLRDGTRKALEEEKG